MIKMVVEIEEDIYEQIKTHHLPDAVMNACTYAITHGTVLPEEEDCISRKAVKETIMKCEKMHEDTMDGYINSTIELEVEIDSLPSVTSIRKER